MSVLEYISRRNPAVERTLLRLLPPGLEPRELAEASRHLIKAGGKRLRPCLTLACCEVVGGEAERALETAAAVELLHTFSLIHDDIMDHSSFRRGVKTVHRIWGEPMAILAGDALFAKVFEALSLNASRIGLEKERTAELFRVMSRASFELSRGQALDLLFSRRLSLREEEYFQMVSLKTGALMWASATSGALLGGGTPSQVRRLGEYGKNLGIAFQIQDDILGLVGEKEELGKPVGSDLTEGKHTLVVSLALRTLRGEERRRLLRTLGNPSAPQEEVEGVIALLRERGILERTRGRALEFSGRARRCLRGFRRSEALSFLEELTDFVIERRM
ncbi:MAG: polyprenyl synthetase family protein [Hadesarchaea archaeon]|jgi:geranylgeranyl diphosphate synthase type I|nr:polyprenyl synthetase family protein [Hadesarchaea archaeon]